MKFKCLYTVTHIIVLTFTVAAFASGELAQSKDLSCRAYGKEKFVQVMDVATCSHYSCWGSPDKASTQVGYLQSNTDATCTGTCAVGACLCGAVACVTAPCNPLGPVGGFYLTCGCFGAAGWLGVHTVRSCVDRLYFSKKLEQLEEAELSCESSSHGNSSSTGASQAPSSSLGDNHAAVIAIFAASHGV